MAVWVPAPRHIVLALFVLSALFVHLRGRVRFGVVRALTDFTVLLAPLNALMYLSSTVRPSAYIDPGQFRELAVLREHWTEIRDEAVRLDDAGAIRAAAGYTDIGFNSFFRTGWKRFYLNWYGVEPPSALRACPKTTQLLRSIPTVKAAMFASLPPGARLVRHRDPYAGSLRYHLGLVTPNSDQCYIAVDGQRYSWRDGEAVMFDETYIHYAENATAQQRVVLLCDVERPLRSGLLTALNRWFARNVMSASATRNVEGEEIGVLNRLFGHFYQARLRAKALKARSRSSYYVLKWLLLGGLFLLIFV
jgi:beta-hydroxylase